MKSEENKVKYKIISDGTSVGTKLIDIEAGKILTGIKEITWNCNADSLLSTCTVTLCNVEIDAVHPYIPLQVSKITFSDDGTVAIDRDLSLEELEK